MDKTEQQMVSRFLEMRKHADRAYEEAGRLSEDAASFGYLATLQYPDFLNHACDSSESKKNTPGDPLDYILTWRSGKVPPEHERRKGETARAWMERIESDMQKFPRRKGEHRFAWTSRIESQKRAKAKGNTHESKTG
jgi:hypothetical protein